MSDVSPYTTTKITDFYLDIWQPNKEIKPLSSDRYITLDAKYSRRPDLLAKELYGSERLWWVFAQRNMDVLIDPINDFLPGVEIYVPASV